MIITIFGASGTVGRYLVTTALERDHKVKAFGRNVEPLSALNHANLVTVTGDLFNAAHVSGVIKGSDVIISAIGGDFSGVEKIRSNGIGFIIAAMKETGVKRIIALGNTGVLETAEGKMLMDTDQFDKQYLPVSEEHRKAYQALRDSGLQFSFFCAPMIKNEPATHQFQVNEEKVMSDKIADEIKAGDLAEAIIKEAETNSYPGKRIGISN
jgi:uncharacterized protein